MEKNKYYTPSIEEFRVGFKYEERDHHSTTIKWDNKIIEVLNDELILLYHQLDVGYIRVKILDKEDIESVEFTFIEEDENSLTFKKEVSEFDYYTLTLIHTQEDFPTIIIDEWSQNKLVSKKVEKDFWTNYTIFHGELKNINELEVLCKQLNIE